MSLKKNEIAINKCVSVNLDPDTIAIIAYVYHTRDKSDPTDTSFYRTEVRVAKKTDLEAEIANMKLPENRTKLWRWSNSTWPADWYLGYDRANDQAKGAKFLTMKIRKALPWDRFENLVKTGTKTLGNGQQKMYSGAQYDSDGYVDSTDPNAATFSILDQKTLLDHLNKPLWKLHPLKRAK